MSTRLLDRSAERLDIDAAAMSFDLGLDPAAIRRREPIARAAGASETTVVRELVDRARLSPASLQQTQSMATLLAHAVRSKRAQAAGVDALMAEFSLGSQEGVALMCLAEALLRIPDAATRDLLIRDKVSRGDWRAHLGSSRSLFVNAAAWGLLVSGKLADRRSEGALDQALASLLRKGGEPLVRKGVDLAMRLLGRQFVTGRDIDEALVNARERELRGYTFSFDMLGEAAMTALDADRYSPRTSTRSTPSARVANTRGIVAGPGISVKLSALHPRYSRAQRERIQAELAPKVLELARLAARYDIGLNIDAEEADRLDISLDVIERARGGAAARAMGRIGFRRAGVSEARAAADRLDRRARAAQRPPYHGAPGQGRVLG